MRGFAVVVTVQLAGEEADSRRQAAGRTLSPGVIERLTNELGIEFRPMHPASADSALRSYYVADVPDDARGARILEQLRENPFIAAAYVKPADAMP
ncbi:MAG: hypothetical protein ACT4P7_21140 [Gemmatimonadaceae bacterium]